MFNHIIIVGTILQTPEIKITSSGLKYANLLVDTQRGFRNSDGEYDHDVLSCTMWRGMVENSLPYCKKGSVVGIKGRIQSHPYTNEDGKTYYNYDIIIEKISYIFNNEVNETQ